MNPSPRKEFYPYVLDYKPGFLLSGFLYRLFKRVSLNENVKEDLKRMQREGTVVYAIKYRGQLDYLLLHHTFRGKRLPYPRLAFDLNMALLLPVGYLLKVVLSQLSSFVKYGRLPNPYQSGFYKRAIERSTTSLIFLVDPKGFSRHFIHAEKDRLEFLLEIQKEVERSIFIVPQLILYKMAPEKEYPDLGSIFFGYRDNPGVMRKILLFFRHNRRAFIDFGPPLDLKAYLESQPPLRSLGDMAVEIREMLIEGIDNQKRVILGPVMKSRQQVKEMVLMDQGVSQRIERMASGNRRRLKRLRKKAGEYFEEIAADYNMTYVESFRLALSWFWRKIFEGIDVDMTGLARVREWALKGPLVYVPCHKSHIDYLILNYVLLEHHMHTPRIAAGRNLAFWPMGHIFRKCGSFFMRRSFTGAKLYSEVFIRYIKALLQEGYSIEFFIEGGRSRNGKLVLPKTGFLSILLQAYDEGFCHDLIFVPTSINYDRVIEEKSYLKEIEGGAKEKESFRQVLKARHFLKRKYGKIYIRFNQPLSLREYLSRANETGREAHRQLAFRLVESINAVSLVTPLSLVATAILAKHRRGFYLAELTETAKTLLSFLKRCDAPMAGTLTDPVQAVQDTLSILISWKVVEFLEDMEKEEETFYYVDEEKKVELEYYKNSIIHFFIPHALVATSIFAGTEEARPLNSIVSDYTFLRDLFKNEFVFDENEDLYERVTSVINYFLDSAFLSRSDGDQGQGYKMTKLGFEKLPIWSSLIKTFLESYWIAVRSISQWKAKGEKDGNLYRSMGYLGKRFYKLGLVEHIEALSQINYRNAAGLINEKILNVAEDSEQERALTLERLSRLDERLYELSHYRP